MVLFGTFCHWQQIHLCLHGIVPQLSYLNGNLMLHKDSTPLAAPHSRGVYSLVHLPILSPSSLPMLQVICTYPWILSWALLSPHVPQILVFLGFCPQTSSSSLVQSLSLTSPYLPHSFTGSHIFSSGPHPSSEFPFQLPSWTLPLGYSAHNTNSTCIKLKSSFYGSDLLFLLFSGSLIGIPSLYQLPNQKPGGKP